MLFRSGTYAAASGDNPSGFSATRCTANEFDLFSGGGVAAPYTEGTGLSAWGKSGNIAGRPGYVKMGAGSAAASLYTPELTALPDAATVKVRFSAQAYSEKYDGSGADAGKILVKAVRGAVLGAKGAITGTVTEVSAADPVDISAAKARFREFEATLTNVTPDCRIVISTSEKRALLDNVVVTCTAITPATKPAAPGGVSFDAAAAADRLTLKWNAVPDATSYTVAYWKGSASAPESEYAYKTGIASTATSQELTNLESNTSYWAKVKAVGSLDSDWSETANATTMDSGGEPLLPTADLLDVVFRNDNNPHLRIHDTVFGVKVSTDIQAKLANHEVVFIPGMKVGGKTISTDLRYSDTGRPLFGNNARNYRSRLGEENPRPRQRVRRRLPSLPGAQPKGMKIG